MISELEEPETLLPMSTPRRSYLPFRNWIHLTQPEASDLMRRILSGEMSVEEVAEILLFLRNKGETVAEIVGFAAAMRELSLPIHVDQTEAPLIDTCGTGGDNADTFNISTAAAFVVAGAGMRVAKHGNRKISSRCGSCDLLEQMGVRVDLSPEQVAGCVQEIGIGFLYAPSFHPSMSNAREARALLRGRTAFNLLGPLTNPARARFQVIGAFSVRAAEMLANASARLGTERAFVVAGGDGLDEITTTTYTTIFQVEDGKVQKGRWWPSDFGLEQSAPDDLKGGDAETNAAIIRSVFDGQPGPARDVVVANAAAAIALGQRASELKAAVAVAAESIDSGAARRKLDELIQFTTNVNA
ncbi:MAG: anthranilate phosphoribosyltransferase [Bryobacteraceae bacterium]